MNKTYTPGLIYVGLHGYGIGQLFIGRSGVGPGPD